MDTITLNLLELEIRKELQLILKSSKVNKSIALIDLTRCIDHWFIGSSFVAKDDTETKVEWTILSKCYSIGWYEALRLFLDDANSYTMLIPSTSKNIKWANKTMDKLGSIGLLKRYIDLDFSSDCCCDKINENSFGFKCEGKEIGIEYLEARSQEWLLQQKLNISDRSHVDKWGSQIHSLLWENVTLKYSDFIQYTSSNFLNTYYYYQGRNYALTRLGYDYYDKETRFGGIPYKFFQEIIFRLVGNSLKRRDFCFKFQDKTFHSLNPWNLYTNIERYQDIVEDIIEQTGFTDNIVKEVLNTVILTKDKLDKIYFPAGYSPPLLIQLDEKYLINSMMGHLCNPFTYLNKLLQYHYKSDWEIAINDREMRFKDELYNLFEEGILKAKNNIVIGDKRSITTDIDAVIYDTKHRIIILIQLKWQEDWATDMRKRRSMRTNYSKEVIKWVQAVNTELNQNGLTKIITKIGDKRIDLHAKVYKLVIGRHFSSFTGSNLPDDTYYINWATLNRVITEHPHSVNSLKIFIEQLDNKPYKENLEYLKSLDQRMEFKVGKYNIHLNLNDK